MITEITRSHVRLKFGERSVKIEGEGFARGFGSPDFVVFANSIRRWDPPFDNEPVDDKAKAQILLDLKTEMDNKGMTLAIE